MAGGPATVALAAAVTEAGGLGFLAAGYRRAADVAGEVAELRERVGDAPFGVNVFVPGDPAAEVDEWALRVYLELLGEGTGEPRFDDDDWQAKLDLLQADPVPVVSFAFGCPSRAEIAALQSAGSEVWVTVTTPDEARRAAEAGADALVLQGIEAGGHRGTWKDSDDAEQFGVLALLRLVSGGSARIPLIAAGGIADGASLAAVMAAGARAAQVGTAFLLAPEAGTNPAHAAELLRGDSPTSLTRAFTGRLARGIENRFMREHSGQAPIAYPHIHHATSPLRAAARARGDAGGFNLWAGQAYPLAVERPAAETVRALSDGALQAREPDAAGT